MPIKIKTDLDFGQPLYIKSDPFQREHILIGVKIAPPNQVIFILRYIDEEIELYDFECSTERDELKYTENKDNNGGDD